MAYVEIEYKDGCFEENPAIITWVQLFFIKLLKELDEKNEWIENIIIEWELNSKIEVYKYFFDETMLDDVSKEEWAISFLKKAEDRIESITLSDFSKFIHLDISSKVDYYRIKNVIKNLRVMIEKSKNS